MALKMVIKSRGQGGLGTKTFCVFGPEGGTVGRGADCSWVLIDPRNEVSSLHASIVFEGGQYCLVDESTNGVFINGSGKALGRGIKVALRQGDVLRMGQYEIGVILGSGADDASTADLSVADGFGLADLVAGQPAEDADLEGDLASDDNHTGYGAFATAGAGSGSSRKTAKAARLDPLTAFDRVPLSSETPVAGGDLAAKLHARPVMRPPATEEDCADSIAGNFRPLEVEARPSAVEDPFDRYLEGIGQGNAKGMPSPGALAAGTTPSTGQQGARAGIAAIDAAMTTLSPQHHNLWPLIEALGLGSTPIPDDRIPGLLRDIGAALRRAVEGLHEAYDQGAGGDPTFRIAAAQLQPLEDNPIKFADSPQAAVACLFGGRRAVHLGAEDAVRECLDGLRLHRQAVAEGTVAGLHAVIVSFGPDALARRFAKYEPERAALVDGNWLWGMFAEYFEEASRYQSHGLRRLFDEVFAQTYDRFVRENAAEGGSLHPSG